MTLIINIDGVDREMTEIEKTIYFEWQTEKQTKIAEKELEIVKKQTIKTATIAKLGLTDDEVAALFS